MDHPDLLDIGAKVSPAKLAALLGVNVSLIYQEHQMGRFGGKPLIEMSYKEALSIYRKNIVNGLEVKAKEAERKHQLELKRIEEKKSAKTVYDSDNSMHPLMAKKLEQDIKLGKIKELHGWMKIAEEKQQFLLESNMLELMIPFVNIIKNGLISLAMDFPETESRVEEFMTSLSDLGDRVLKECKKDEESFVEYMMNKGIDDGFPELAFVPEDA